MKGGKLRILIACEFSGRVRDALLMRGHDAVSCDFLPSETPGPHIQSDVLSLLCDGYQGIATAIADQWFTQTPLSQEAK